MSEEPSAPHLPGRSVRRGPLRLRRGSIPLAFLARRKHAPIVTSPLRSWSELRAVEAQAGLASARAARRLADDATREAHDAGRARAAVDAALASEAPAVGLVSVRELVRSSARISQLVDDVRATTARLARASFVAAQASASASTLERAALVAMAEQRTTSARADRHARDDRRRQLDLQDEHAIEERAR